ncbi:hypothetical protein AGABI1DRAFT_113150 [Agaricus bisporus var. burnettii JB137-S8]|uniref:Ribosome biogenesis regulatory protein n=2 Tax=Agaricus bisporus var. burnettii TaxID=192524 RepID=K5WWM8_AGABU|nr:uncharacterized protein AGABI1DRAFT_113150 [Agaricus bisporus var. burnettii JB137-S8]EKM79901.1 hypothetical protein AGABI1DRAFT_113150 [Agaricus bisporus var. burnettii JB137-S8]KAF7775744.1 hypothetical protein Agabi119p4_4137 [Agaricus bisporus var. burnettii]
MDVSSILGSFGPTQDDNDPEESNYILDAGYLTVTNTTPIDADLYNENIEQSIEQNARESSQKLLGALFHLPSTASADGRLALLPPPTFALPREKPLPKAKEMTKWERFAAAKGIQKKKREKKIWDEEKQEWVDRWGWKGKNKEGETQWLHEVPSNADVDHDPRKIARDERKARTAKNEKQKLQNLSHSTGQSSNDRKQEIERTLATTRVSTASIGKFDRQLEGEKKPRGIKRKFEPTEVSAEQEKKNALALFSSINSDSRKKRPETSGDNSVINVRKAIRTASKGQGGVALARKLDSGKRKSKR